MNKAVKRSVTNCAFCGSSFVMKKGQIERQKNRNQLLFFCGKACSMSHRHRNNSVFRSALAESAKSHRLVITERILAAKAKASEPEAIEKMRRALIEIGHRPMVRRGNGQGLTSPQSMLWVDLYQVKGDDWVPEYVVLTSRDRKDGYPAHYKIDLACPLLMIAVEVDGSSHRAKKIKARDEKKSELLKSMGWKVVRFKNEEILSDSAHCARAVYLI